MLTYVVDICVQEQNEGGFVTQHLERVTDWIIKPENEFLESLGTFIYVSHFLSPLILE